MKSAYISATKHRSMKSSTSICARMDEIRP
jgi:hypothetical protein